MSVILTILQSDYFLLYLVNVLSYNINVKKADNVFSLSKFEEEGIILWKKLLRLSKDLSRVLQ